MKILQNGLVMIGALLVLAGAGLCASYVLGGADPGKLDLKIQTKPTLMTVAYKAYGNAEAADGKYWLAKLVIRNTGGSPLDDLSVSYRVPDYIDWTTPDTTAEVLPGQTLVMPIYPHFTSAVTKTRTRTPAQIEIKVEYSTVGKSQTVVEKRPFELRGITEIEYTSIESDEILSWYDMWDNSEILAAYMTDEDDVVKAYFGKISETMGGTPYVSNNEQLGKLLSAIYQFEVGTGMVYMGAKGVPETLGETQTLVQSIKLPRDVIRGNSGTCIELTILMSALLNQCGVKSYMVLIPGHAFPVIETPDGQMVAFECTGIGGEALGGVSSFEQAYKSGNETWEKCLKGETPYVMVDYQAYQATGLRPPELEPVDVTNLLQMLSDRVARRTAAAGDQTQQAQQTQTQTQPQPQPDPNVTPGPNPAPTNFAAYRDPTGRLTVPYPAGWATDPNLIATVQQSGAPWYLFAAADVQSGWEVGVYGFSSPDQTACSQALYQLGLQLGINIAYGQPQTVQIQGRQWNMVPLSFTNPMGIPCTGQFYMHTTDQGTYGFSVSGPAQTAGAAGASVNQIIQNVLLAGP